MKSFLKKTLKSKEKAFFRALENKDIAAVRELLKDGVDPNVAYSSDYEGNSTALMQAAGYLFTEAVRLLLEKGADPNARTLTGLGTTGGTTALHAALAGAEPVTVEMPKTDTDLIEVVDLLIHAGADLNAERDGRTPLYEAAADGHFEIVCKFLERGVTVAVPQGHISPLCGAAAGRHLPVARLLVERGAPVDAADLDGVTALMISAYNGGYDVLSFLLEKGADVNHRSNDGRAPLIAACQFARNAVTERQHQTALRMVKRLVEAGADPRVRDKKGKAALDWALLAENRLVTDFLENLTSQP